MWLVKFKLTWAVLVTLLSHFSVVANGQSQRRLIGNPDRDRIEVETTNSIGITCIPVSSEPAVDLKWYGPNEYFPQETEKNLIKSRSQMPKETDPAGDSRIYTIQIDNVLELYITDVRSTDAGEYKCSGRVENIASEWTFTLSAYIGLEITAETDQFLLKDRDSWIDCVVTSSVTVVWMKDDVVINADTDPKYVSLPSRGLEVKDVIDSDAGIYRCQGKDSNAQIQSTDIYVEVVTEPEWTSPPSNGTGIVRGNGVLRCQATGIPSPQYRWYPGTATDKGPTPISQASHGHRFIPNPDDGELTVENVLLEDEAWYWCEAANRAKAISGRAFFDVLLFPEFVDGYNQNITNRKSGETVELRCQSVGEPAPRMWFHRTDMELPYLMGEQETDSRITMTQYQTPENVENQRVRTEELVLTITNASIFDTANYTCNSENQAGKNRSQLHIIVNHEPSFELTPTSYESQCIWQNHVRNVTLLLTGYPLPSITWSRADGNAINEGDSEYRVYKIFLEPYWNNDRPDQWMTNLQINWTSVNQGAGGLYSPVGDYRVSATNNIGSPNQYVVVVQKAMLPNQVRNVEVVLSGPRTIVFSADPPPQVSCIPVIAIRIEYVRSGSNDPLSFKVFNVTTSHHMVLDQLFSGATYRVNIFAVNQRGHDQSNRYSAIHTTAPATKPEPVTVTSSDPTHATKFLVTWSRPDDGGSDITEYIIRYREVGTITWQEKRVDWGREDVTISDLTPGSQYELTVQAMNQLGISDVPDTFFTFRMNGGEGDTQKTFNPVVGQYGDILVYLIILGVLGLIILLLAIDMMCYCANNCGLMAIICGNMRKQPQPRPIDLVSLDGAGSNASSVPSQRGKDNLQYKYDSDSPSSKAIPAPSSRRRGTFGSHSELGESQRHQYQNTSRLNSSSRPLSTASRPAPDKPVPQPRPPSRGPGSRSNSQDMLDREPPPLYQPRSQPESRGYEPRSRPGPQGYQPRPQPNPTFSSYAPQQNPDSGYSPQPRSRLPYAAHMQRGYSGDHLDDVDYTDRLRTNTPPTPSKRPTMI